MQGRRAPVKLVELYIDRGRGAEQENKAIYEQLYESREAIENEFQGELDWQRLKRSYRVRKVFDTGGLANEERWPKIQDELIDAMVRLHDAMKPHVAKLTV